MTSPSPRLRGSLLVKTALGAAVAGLCLYLFLKDVDVRNLAAEVQSINPFSLAPVGFFVVLTIYLRALRWRYMLPDTAGASKHNLFGTVMIGFMINNIIPARIGEFARAFILWKKNRFPLTVSLGSLVLERIIDILIFSLFFIVPVFALPQCASLRHFALIIAAGTAGAVACALFYVLFPHLTKTAVRWLITLLPVRFQTKIRTILKDLGATLHWLSSVKKSLIVISLSFATLLCYPPMIIILARSAGTPLGFLEGVFAQAFAAFGAAIPLSPGYVGTLHAVMLQGLDILGVDGDKARVLVILYHAVNYVLITALGLFYLLRMRLSIKEISTAQKEMAD